MRNQTYWATEPPNDIGNKLIEKVKAYFQYLDHSGKMEVYRKSYKAYFNPALRGCQAESTGEQGELVSISVNNYRNLLKHLHTLTTSQRPAFETRAINTDHKSQAQCQLAQGLLEYYLREKKLEVFLKSAVEYALIYAEGFISCIWDAKLGKQYGVDQESGIVIYEGDIEYRSFGPLDYIRDFSKISPFDHLWGIPIDWVNKYELAARFPEFEDTIINITDNDDFYDGIDSFRESRREMYGTYDTDEIPFFVFYHAPSDALPEGRQVQFLSDGTVLIDEPIPYPDVPVYRVACSEWLGTPFGYSTGYDLLPVQEMSDSLHSTICTNQNAFGVQNIWTKKGSGLEVSSLSGGLRHLESDEKPEALQLMATAPETYKYLEALNMVMETLSGINAVARGNPEREMSGSAMALLQSMSIQFSMDLQSSYVVIFEDVGTATLDRLKTFATVPRVAAIVGKSNKHLMQEFKGDDIKDVNRVLVNVGNPIMSTTAGKMEMANQLLSTGLLKTPEQYIQVFTTGDLEPLYENLQSELMLIKGENEQISNGQVPPVLVTDNPLLHIKEHSIVGNSPEARANPQIMQSYVAHVQDHIDKWRTMDPDLAGMLGLPPPPQQMMPGMMPPGAMPPGQEQPQENPQGQEPSPDGQPMPEGPGPGPGQLTNANNPQTAGAADVNMPNMPNLPPGTDAQTASLKGPQ